MKRTWLQWVTGVSALLVIGLLASTRMVGVFSHQVLMVVLVAGAGWGLASRIFLWWRKGLVPGFLRAPLRAAHRPQLFQFLGRGFFWISVTLTIALVFPRIGLGGILLGVVVVGLFRVGLEFLPPKKTGRPVTVVLAVSGLLLSIELARALLPGAPADVILEPPFSGEWIVLQGGNVPLVSHHRIAYNQLHALDLMRLEAGAAYGEGEGTNADNHSWDQWLYAPAAGTVVTAKDDVEDSEGLNLVSSNAEAAGNFVVIEMNDGRFVVLAHLRKGSVVVAEGDEVTPGQRLGRVGNSGNTSTPHLHMQVQTHADLWHTENRSLPFAFQSRGRALSRNDLVVGSPK